MVLELNVLGIARKLLVPSITLCKKDSKKILKFTTQGLPKTQSTIILLIGILRVNDACIGSSKNISFLDNFLLMNKNKFELF